MVRLDCPVAVDADLLLCHSAKHVKDVKDTIYMASSSFESSPLFKSDGKFESKVKEDEGDGKQNESRDLMDEDDYTNRFSGDCYENMHTARAAYLAAGGTLEAVKAVCDPTASNYVDTAFAIVRPPGHHAHCSKACGFCFFNNVPIAARVAQQKYNKKKVAIFDWDVHVGDGSSDIFYEDDSVLYISLHRFDNGLFYPGSIGAHDRIGEGKGKGYNIHFPFSATKFGDEDQWDNDYIYACHMLLFPLIKAFKPDLILVSAGFDSAKGDPLGGIGVTPVGYAWITYGLRQLQSTMAVVLEGGYNLEALASSSEAVIRVL